MFGKCETMVHGVKSMLDLRLEWAILLLHVQNSFNLVFRITIFQKLRSCIGTLD
jgi:hypothetical protein